MDAALALDRFEDDCSCVGIDGFVELVEVVERNVGDVRQDAGERLAVLLVGRGRQRADRPTVVAATSRDELAFGLSGGVRICKAGVEYCSKREPVEADHSAWEKHRDCFGAVRDEQAVRKQGCNCD